LCWHWIDGRPKARQKKCHSIAILAILAKANIWQKLTFGKSQY
jgi:hypothetical protein